jgi:hypothetical protein
VPYYILSNPLTLFMANKKEKKSVLQCSYMCIIFFHQWSTREKYIFVLKKTPSILTHKYRYVYIEKIQDISQKIGLL